MPPLEHMDLREYAVLWEIARYDGNGQPLLVAPVEIRVRWEEGQTDMLDDMGQQIKVDGVLAVARDIVMDSLVWEGNLSDLNGSPPPTNLYQVQFRVRAKDLKQRVTRYEFALKRFRDSLPDLV